jgi:phenylacetate-CoA ligase
VTTLGHITGGATHGRHHREVLTQPWHWLVRHLVLPAGDRLFGQRMMARLEMLESAQWWPQAALYAERDRSLRALIRTAYDEVPLYRSLMDGAGVRPEEIRTAADLQRLPIVTKAMLRDAYPARSVRPTPYRDFEVSSSGSTGRNVVVREDTETAGWWRASLLLAFSWAGWNIGEPHMQTGIATPRSREGWLKDILLQCDYVSAYDLTDGHLDAALERLERRRIMHLRGYPCSLFYLASRALSRGRRYRLRSVVTWGDNLFAHYRSTIEEAFGCRVFDTYGMGEGIQVAAQCGRDSTYHIHALDVIVETLDDQARPVGPGQPGHVVLTRLHPGPMPLIRYQVGDLAVLGDRRCSCGRGYDVLESVEGRDTDVVLTPRGNRLIVHFFTGVLEYFRSIDAYQIIQREPDAIVVRVVPGAGYTAETADQIVEALRQRGADDLRIDIECADDIPPTPSGKRRLVLSEVARAAAAGVHRANHR